MAKKVARDHMLEVESKLGSKRKIVPLPRPGPSSVKQRKVIGTTEYNTRTKPCTSTDHLEVLNEEGICRSSVVPGRCLRECNTPVATPLNTPSKILSKLFPTPGIKNTPNETSKEKCDRSAVCIKIIKDNTQTCTRHSEQPDVPKRYCHNTMLNNPKRKASYNYLICGLFCTESFVYKC